LVAFAAFVALGAAADGAADVAFVALGAAADGAADVAFAAALGARVLR
jgi:hypothetical protein